MLCAVSWCKNSNKNNNKNKKENVRYYSFPEDPELSKKWVDFCKKTDKFNTQQSKVCIDHFTADDFERNLRFEMGFTKKNTLKLKPGVVPSVMIQIEDDTEPLATDPESANDIFVQQFVEYRTKITKLQQDNFRLRINEEKLQKTIKTLQTQLNKSQYQSKHMETRLKTIFTDAQINKLRTEDKRVKWSELDIAKALTLYSAGSRAYKMLKRDKFPLPSVRTLQRWTQKSDPKIANFDMKMLSEEINDEDEEDEEEKEAEEVNAPTFDDEVAENEESSDDNFQGLDYDDHSYA